MKLADFQRLKKLMGLTFSEADGEALNALRAANRLLVAERLTWERVLDRTVQVGADVEPAETAPTDGLSAEVDAAFETVLDTAGGSFRTFVLDLHEQWTRHHHLSPNQLAALFRARDRVRSGGRR